MGYKILLQIYALYVGSQELWGAERCVGPTIAVVEETFLNLKRNTQ
jgi:hypothetical protein